MPRAVPHTRYDYKSGTTTKDWLGQSREDAVADSAAGLTSSTAIALLNSAAVDLNEGTGAKQPLYTVPASKICVPMFLVFRSASGVCAIAEGNVGFNAAADDIVVGLALNLLSTTNTKTSNPVDWDAQPLGVAAAVLGFAVTTPEGSALTATVDVFGYLIAA